MTGVEYLPGYFNCNTTDRNEQQSDIIHTRCTQDMLRNRNHVKKGTGISTEDLSEPGKNVQADEVRIK